MQMWLHGAADNWQASTATSPPLWEGDQQAATLLAWRVLRHLRSLLVQISGALGLIAMSSDADRIHYDIALLATCLSGVPNELIVALES